MSSPNGTDNRINFYDYKLKMQDPYPELVYESEDKVYQMRPTSVGPGNRVHKSLGSNINHAVIPFTAHSLTDTEMSYLINMYTSRPNVVMLSLDSGATRYYAKFKENGLKGLGYKNNEDPYTSKAYFLKADIGLSILMSTTDNFS
jgi:hypothetical protein